MNEVFCRVVEALDAVNEALISTDAPLPRVIEDLLCDAEETLREAAKLLACLMVSDMG